MRAIWHKPQLIWRNASPLIYRSINSPIRKRSSPFQRSFTSGPNPANPKRPSASKTATHLTCSLSSNKSKPTTAHGSPKTQTTAISAPHPPSPLQENNPAPVARTGASRHQTPTPNHKATRLRPWHTRRPGRKNRGLAPSNANPKSQGHASPPVAYPPPRSQEPGPRTTELQL